LLLVLVLVLIDARSVKNLQVRASKRIIKKAHAKDPLPPWCTDTAQVKAKVAGESKCEFFTACVKAASATTIEDARCTRLAALAAANGLGEASLGVRDLYLVSSALAIAPILGGPEDAATKQTKIDAAVAAVFANNFGTGANNGDAPAVPAGAPAPTDAAPAPDAATPTPTPSFLDESETATGDAAAPSTPSPAPDAAAPPPDAAPKPEVENNGAPTFCACPRAEQIVLVGTWMPDAQPVPIDQVEAKIATLNCPGGDFHQMFGDELTALKTKAADVYDKIKNFLTTAISGWTEGAAGGDAAAPADAAQHPIPQGDAAPPPTP